MEVTDKKVHCYWVLLWWSSIIPMVVILQWNAQSIVGHGDEFKKEKGYKEFSLNTLLGGS